MLAGFGRVELAGVLRMSVQDMQLSDCTCLSDNAFFFAVDDVGPTSKQDPATWRRTLFPADYGSRCADTLSPQPSTLNPQPGVLTADALEAQRPQQKRTASRASMLLPLHCQRR